MKKFVIIGLLIGNIALVVGCNKTATPVLAPQPSIAQNTSASSQSADQPVTTPAPASTPATSAPATVTASAPATTVAPAASTPAPKPAPKPTPTPAPTPMPTPTPTVSGKNVYDKNCSGCHGAGGSGASAPALNTGGWTQAQVLGITKQGAGRMPGYANSLSNAEIQAVAQYVADLKK